MNIFDRQRMNLIEGFNLKELEDILYERASEEYPKIDTIVFDSILLTNGITIKCIKNYYKDLKGNIPKKAKGANACPITQKFYGVNCRPYNCERCHKIMLDKRNNKEVKPR